MYRHTAILCVSAIPSTCLERLGRMFFNFLKKERSFIPRNEMVRETFMDTHTTLSVTLSAALLEKIVFG